jgi:hypothetical protein
VRLPSRVLLSAKFIDVFAITFPTLRLPDEGWRKLSQRFLSSYVVFWMCVQTVFYRLAISIESTGSWSS